MRMTSRTWSSNFRGRDSMPAPWILSNPVSGILGRIGGENRPKKR